MSKTYSESCQGTSIALNTATITWTCVSPFVQREISRSSATATSSPLFVRRKLPVLFGRKIQSQFPSICRLAGASQLPLLPIFIGPMFSFFFFLYYCSIERSLILPSNFSISDVWIIYLKEYFRREKSILDVINK